MALTTVKGSVWNPEDNTFLASFSGAVARSLRSKLEEKVSLKDFNPTGGVVDDNTAFQAFVSHLNANGGVGVIPFNGIGYSLSGSLAFTRSDITIIIEEDITSLATSANSLFSFIGTSTAAPISNIQIIGVGHPKLDGNGSNVAGYTYSSSDAYDTCYCKYVHNLYIENIRFDNGLMNSFRTVSCKQPIIGPNCEFTNAVHDNGLSINQDLDTYAEATIATWCNGRIYGAIAYGNKDFGLTAFNSSGVEFYGCLAYSNGIDTASEQEGGGMSSESITGKNQYTKFVSCRAISNNINGFHQTGNEVFYIECEGSKTLNINGADVWQGSGIGAIAATGTYIHGGQYNSNADNGIFAQQGDVGAGTERPFIEITGRCEIGLNTERGIYVAGLTKALVGKDVYVHGNLATSQQILLDNSTSNLSSGDAYVHCMVNDAPGGKAARIVGTRHAEFSGMRCRNNSVAGAIPLEIDSSTGTITDAVILSNSLTSPVVQPTFLCNTTGTITNEYSDANIGSYSTGIIA